MNDIIVSFSFCSLLKFCSVLVLVHVCFSITKLLLRQKSFCQEIKSLTFAFVLRLYFGFLLERTPKHFQLQIKHCTLDLVIIDNNLE